MQSSNPAIGTTSGGGSYNYLTPVNITAIPNAGYHFIQWSDGNTDNPRLISVTQNATYVAQFAINSYAVGVMSNNTTMGGVSGSGTYNHNASATLTATAFYGYNFVQWSDGNTSNPRVVTVSGEATYTAVFEPVMYTVTLTANDYSMGQVVGGGSYAYGTSVTLEASAFEDYRFVRWSDGDTTEVRSITVTEDIQLEATFERKNPDGIDDVEGVAYNVYVQQRHIIVEGVEKNRVQIFDVAGRQHSHDEQLPTGVYILRIDNRVTKKVVVM